METEKTRKQYRFFGRVQGVGFRWTAMHAAYGLGVTGWIRNDYCGTVTMEAQGRPEELDALIATIRSSRYIVIVKIDEKEMPLDMEERDFDVKHDWQ